MKENTLLIVGICLVLLIILSFVSGLIPYQPQVSVVRVGNYLISGVPKEFSKIQTSDTKKIIGDLSANQISNNMNCLLKNKLCK